jgi:hypothetical protein
VRLLLIPDMHTDMYLQEICEHAGAALKVFTYADLSRSVHQRFRKVPSSSITYERRYLATESLVEGDRIWMGAEERYAAEVL